jgi:hypothetical protein
MELIVAFKALKEELLPLKKDPFESVIFEEIDIIAWIDQKIGL